ncbi:MAG: hypothetical protein V3T31_12170, partial [candidate division Zixibacteria bacterium]
MRQYNFEKYHALENDFLVIESESGRPRRDSMAKLALAICDRRSGVGADGIIVLSPSATSDRAIDIYNADGSWAEKSGNGLRIAAAHLFCKSRSKKKQFVFQIANSIDKVSIGRATKTEFMATAEIGKPEFDTKLI